MDKIITIDQYILNFPIDIQKELTKLRTVIMIMHLV